MLNGMTSVRDINLKSIRFGNQQPKKETREEMLKRHKREALAARSQAGGGDPRYSNVPPDVLKRHAYELATLEGRDTRHGNPS